MKTLLLSLCLLLGACASNPPDLLSTDGALGRQVERVVNRHDDYVLDDALLSQTEADVALAQSAALESLIGLPDVSRGSLQRALAPVADRHDSYVRADAALDDLERDTYLASTDGLRRLSGLGLDE